ncbi:MAG: hypothetical protein HYY05_04370 [Chloroflexi bacterium]|nr:hypothetical protein [Chloroflexota bacterium]
MERHGIPTVSVVTQKFAAMAREEAKYMAAEGLPLLVIPHPLEGLPRAAIERVVTEQVGVLEEALLRPAARPVPGRVGQ